jgi:hypothetical protein
MMMSSPRVTERSETYSMNTPTENSPGKLNVLPKKDRKKIANLLHQTSTALLSFRSQHEVEKRRLTRVGLLENNINYISHKPEEKSYR